jgi:putative peptide zinc metalloprotease protein
MRRIAALVTTFTLVLAFPASAGGPSNVVKASPSDDGVHVYRAGVKVNSTGASSITSTNLALARPTSCTGCEGVAVAFQGVIVTGNPSDFRPTNAGVAVNTDCTGCGAFAYAYQYLVSADPGSELSTAAEAQIAEVRSEANRLARAGLSYEELDAALDRLATQFKAVIVDDLTQAGDDPHDPVRAADTDAEPAA